VLDRPAFPTRTFLLLVLFTLALLYTDMRTAWMGDQTESNQIVSTATPQGGTPSTENRLTVYLAEGESLASGFRTALQETLQVKEIPLDQVEFHRGLPDGATGPILLVRVKSAVGFWTPLYASRRVEATLHFTHGMVIQRDQAEAVLSGRQLQIDMRENCKGQCADGQTQLTLSSRAVGLVSVPAINRYSTEGLARAAAALVQDGLPEHMNPKNWSERAAALVEEHLPKSTSGSRWSTYDRLDGCRGGVIVGGTYGGWVAAYYDATTDSLTDTVTNTDLNPLMRKHFGEERLDPSLSVGMGEKGLFLPLDPQADGARHTIQIPFEGCGLGSPTVVNGGWEELL
jgi:hypothetical protein